MLMGGLGIWTGEQRGARARAQGQFCARAIIIIQLLYATNKNVTGSRGRLPGQGVKGQSPPEAETLSFWTFNGSRRSDICVVLQKWRLISHTLACVYGYQRAFYHHQNFSSVAAVGQGQGHGGSCPPMSSSGAAHANAGQLGYGVRSAHGRNSWASLAFL